MAFRKIIAQVLLTLIPRLHDRANIELARPANI